MLAFSAGAQDLPAGITLGVLKCFALKLETFMYNVAFNTASAKGDNGMDNVYMNPLAEPKAMKLVAKQADRFIAMNFVGRVTALPLKGSLPVCEAFGVTFYVHNPMGREGVIGEHFVPAWLVAEAENDDAATMQLDTETRNMEFSYVEPRAPDSMATSVSLVSGSHKVKFWKLTCKTAAQGLENVLLTRPSVDGMINEACDVLKTIKKKRAEAKGGNSGINDAALQEWRRCAKHLFK